MGQVFSGLVRDASVGVAERVTVAVMTLASVLLLTCVLMLVADRRVVFLWIFSVALSTVLVLGIVTLAIGSTETRMQMLGFQVVMLVVMSVGWLVSAVLSKVGLPTIQLGGSARGRYGY